MGRPLHAGKERGNALAVAIIVVVIVAGLAAAIMSIVLQDHKQAEATIVVTRVEYIAEAGAGQSIADLTTGGTGNLGSKTALVGFGGGGFYATATDNGDTTWSIVSVGKLGEQTRVLEVVLAPKSVPLFTKALFGDLDLAAKGNVFTDSYDSDAGTYASQATLVDPVSGRTYAKKSGSLGSNGNIRINGSVIVLGDATPGPGKSVIISGGSAFIAGSTTPAANRQELPRIEYPPAGPTTATFSTSGASTFTAGEYHYHDFTAKASAEVHIQGDVTLYVDDVFDFSGQAELIIDPGASLTVYHEGTDFSLTGGGMLNQTGLPANFKLFSKATNVKFGGNSSFTGAVYAPYAVINPGGTTDIFGSFVGSQVTVDGSANFHYDESLSKSPDTITYLRPVSWRRLSEGALP